MGQSTGHGGAPGADKDASRVAAPDAGFAPFAAESDPPYVPRVFAFDPNVAAAVVADGPDADDDVPAGPASTAKSPAPARASALAATFAVPQLAVTEVEAPPKQIVDSEASQDVDADYGTPHDVEALQPRALDVQPPRDPEVPQPSDLAAARPVEAARPVGTVAVELAAAEAKAAVAKGSDEDLGDLDEPDAGVPAPSSMPPAVPPRLRPKSPVARPAPPRFHVSRPEPGTGVAATEPWERANVATGPAFSPVRAGTSATNGAGETSHPGTVEGFVDKSERRGWGRKSVLPPKLPPTDTGGDVLPAAAQPNTLDSAPGDITPIAGAGSTSLAAADTTAQGDAGSAAQPGDSVPQGTPDDPSQPPTTAAPTQVITGAGHGGSETRVMAPLDMSSPTADDHESDLPTSAAPTSAMPADPTNASAAPHGQTSVPALRISTFMPVSAAAPPPEVKFPATGTTPPAAQTPQAAPASSGTRPPSPLDGFSDSKPRRGWLRALGWTAAGVLVLGGLYTGAQWYFSDKIPSKTSVAGVEIGGLSATAAEKKLTDVLGARAVEPVAVVAGDAKASLDPKESGLVFDARATTKELTTFTMNPVTLWDHVFGGEDTKPVVHIDRERLGAQVDGLKETLNEDPVDGTVQFVDGVPTATPAKDGTELDAPASTALIAEKWLVTEGPYTLPTEAVAPNITQAKTDAALALAQKVVSAPVVVDVGNQKPELPADVLAGAAAITPENGELALSFDGAKLTTAVVDRTNNLLTTAKDAKFVFANGAPSIQGGTKGTTLDPAALAEAVKGAAVGDNRTATVQLTESDPENSLEVLKGLGIKEVVSSFDTPITNDATRTKNLVRGAEKVTGQLIKPGETFSLTKALEPITAAGGYFMAGVVSDGIHTEGIGGGLSQMATTTYNAAYFAGLQDVEHRQHSYWFSRYPAGREATLFVGSLDMRFKNDTPYGLLMQSWVGGGRLHVQIWSTKYYTVETSAGPKTNVVPITKVTRSGPRCEPSGGGNNGFTITNYRKVYLDGKLVKNEKNTWTYKPDNAVTCS